MSDLKEIVGQLAISTQATGKQVSSLAFEVQRVLAQIGEATARNTAAVDSLAASVRASNQRQDVAFQAIQEMQSEVRGLQTENHRILDRMEQHFSDGYGAA